jgi:uncharacterized damage-inducible protein DinB
VITPAFAATMARYNRWQNDSLLAAADALTDEARRANRGAFFGSIHGTFSHLFWGDRIWMHRFAGTPKPDGGIAQSQSMVADWDAFAAERQRFDDVIADWADGLDDAWFAADLTWWSGAAGREVTRPRPALVMHFFNHQTHHRGQIHAMLTAAGAKPSDTDLFMLPD